MLLHFCNYITRGRGAHFKCFGLLCVACMRCVTHRYCYYNVLAHPTALPPLGTLLCFHFWSLPVDVDGNGYGRVAAEPILFRACLASKQPAEGSLISGKAVDTGSRLA